MLDLDEYLHLAIHASAVGDRHACMKYLKRVLRQQPRSAQALQLLAIQHAHIGLHGRAIAEMKEAVALDARVELGRLELGWLFLGQGRSIEAKEQFSLLQSSTDTALRGYGEALIALVDDNTEVARTKLVAALTLKAPNEDLRDFMKQLLARLTSPAPAPTPPPKPNEEPVFLGAYAKDSR